VSVKCHLPLITTRIEFQFNILPPPPQITPRRNLGAVIRRLARRPTPYTRSNQEDTPITTHHTDPPDSPLTDMTDSDADISGVEETEMSSHKISKPKGEAGRSNSGGYNLQVAMGWEDGEFASQQKYIINEIGKKLDIKTCYSKQKREEHIIQTAKWFKIQDKYNNDWPIRDALKLRLKYTSDWEKKKDNRKIEARLKQVHMERFPPRHFLVIISIVCCLLLLKLCMWVWLVGLVTGS